jgi:hypothetical protein
MDQNEMTAPDLNTRLTVLEDDHQDLKAEMAATTLSLQNRIALTEEALRVYRAEQAAALQAIRTEQADGRRDTAASLSQIQSTLQAVQTDAFNSLPKWAADERAIAARKAETDSGMKGIMLGALVSLIGVIVALAIAMYTHTV